MIYKKVKRLDFFSFKKKKDLILYFEKAVYLIKIHQQNIESCKFTNLSSFYASDQVDNKDHRQTQECLIQARIGLQQLVKFILKLPYTYM